MERLFFFYIVPGSRLLVFIPALLLNIFFLVVYTAAITLTVKALI